MKEIRYTLVNAFVLSVIFFSCGSPTKEPSPVKPTSVENYLLPEDLDEEKNPDAEFGPLQNISDVNAQLILTPEHPLSKGSNSIYTPGMIFSWQETIKLSGIPDEKSITSKDLEILNRYKLPDSLMSGYFQSEINLDDGILIRSSCSKAFGFRPSFNKYFEPLKFKGKDVAAFFMWGSNEKLAEIVDILYYKDDDHFIISIRTDDPTIRVVAAKGVSGNTFAELQEQTDALILKGKEDKVKKPRVVKINDKDLLVIPNFNINLEDQFPGLANQAFTSGGKPHHILMASEKIGFILNEKGGKLRITTKMLTDSAYVDNEPPPAPKKLLFNKSFYLTIQRTNSKVPYISFFVNDPAILQPYKEISSK